MVMQVVETLKMDDGAEKGIEGTTSTTTTTNNTSGEAKQSAFAGQKEEAGLTTPPPTREGSSLDENNNSKQQKGLEQLHDFETSDSNLPLSGPMALPGAASFDSTDAAVAVSAPTTTTTTKSVHPKRKEELLLQARVERLRWIDQVPLPYKVVAASTLEDSSPQQQLAVGVMDGEQKERLAMFCSSHAAKELPTALPLIDHLYSMSSSTKNNSTRLVDRLESLTPSDIAKTTIVPTGEQLLVEAVQDCKIRAENNSNDEDCNQLLQQLTAYQDFWMRLRDPASAMLVQGMRNFCHALQGKQDAAEMATQCQAYLESQLSTVTSHTAWKDYQLAVEQQQQSPRGSRHGSNEKDTAQQLAGIRRSLESFIYGQLSSHLESVLLRGAANGSSSSSTAATTPTTRKTQEQEWMDRLESLQFVTPAHLEISCLEADDNDNNTLTTRSLLEAPVQALLSVDRYHSPYEKLQRILQVYRAVNVALSQALNRAQTTDSSNKKLPSADDVLPTMILVLLQARPARLLLNLTLVEEWSPAEYLRGEAGYAYTNLYGAVHFLQDLDLNVGSNGDDANEIMKKNHLSMSPDEFRKGLEACRARMMEQEQKRQQLQTAATATTLSGAPVVGDGNDDDDDEVTMVELPAIPPHEIRQARLRGEAIDLEWARQWTQRQLAEQQQQQDDSGAAPNNNKNNEPPPMRSAFDEATDALPTGFTRHYTFLNSSPEDIRLADLPQLLGEYRMLVHATEGLIADRASKITAARKSKAAQTKKDLFDRVREVDPSLLPSTNGSPWRKQGHNSTGAAGGS